MFIINVIINRLFRIYMKKYLSKGLGFLVLSSLFLGATPALAAENPTTDPSPAVTTTTATLGGTNDDATDAGTQAFWYGPTSEGPFVSGPAPTLPPGWTGGIYADTFNPAPDVAGGDFSFTQTGLTSSTTYYYVAWVSVGGIWYPGNEESFTTDTVFIPQTIVFDPLTPTTKTYGDPTFSVLATGGASGNPVTFSTASSACSVTPDGSVVTVLNAGSCVIDANQAGNGTYSAAPQVQATITVSPVALTVTAATDTRSYNGDNTSSVLPTITSGSLVGTDVANFTQIYDNKNVGTGKTLTPAGTVTDGNGGANYTYTFVDDTTGVITPVPLTVTSVFNSKVYDGNTSSTNTPSITGTIMPGDTSGFVQTYNNKNIGAGKLLTASGVVNDGNGGANYSVTLVNSTNGVITPKTLTITSLSAANKVYDATTSATISGPLSLVGVVGLEDVAISGTAVGTFVNKNVGTNKNVAVTGLSLLGTDIGNYTLTLPTLTADITAAPLTITAQTNTKTYNGTVVASAAPLVSGLLGTDTVTGLAETYDNKNAGTNKTLSVSAYTVNDGNSGNNYSVSLVTNTTGVINQKAITVTGAANTKTYDGNTTASTVPTVTGGLASGDVANFIETYDNPNFGSSKVMTPSGVVNDGNGGANYAVTFVNSANGTINKKNLTITGATGVGKTYDANTTAAVNFGGASLVGVVVPDVVTINSGAYTATFSSKNFGSRTITVTGVTLGGAGAGNYTVSQPSGLSATIAKRPITVTAQTNTKVYDGTTSSGAVPTITAGTLAGAETATWSQTYNNENVGVTKTLTPAGAVNDGLSGTNYTVTFVNNATGVITTRTLVITATGVNKVYDGNTTATVTLGDNRVAGDILTTSYTTASFADKNVGVAKPVTVTGISISGADAGNYTANTTANTTANIAVASLTPSADASDKTYNAALDASATCSVNPLGSDDVDCVVGTALFSDKNVANNKTVTVSGMTITGADAGNYVLSTTTDTDTADIDPATLTVGAIAQNKQFDGNTTATVTLANDAFVGDVVTQTYTTADFDTADVGVGKTVTVNGITTSGADAGNYTANTSAITTADITQQPSSGGGGSRPRPRTVTGTTGTVLGAEKFTFTLLMKQGSVGNEVMELQKFLNANGFGPLVVDGKFGPMTRAAVVKFQLANGLKGDGIVGPLTRAVLNK